MKVSVVSLNMWFNGGLLSQAIDFLKQQDADIVLLQEVTNGTGDVFAEQEKAFSALKDDLPYDYSAFELMFKLKSSDVELPIGNAVLSKFPITNSSSNFFFEPPLPVYEDIPEHWPLIPRMLQHVRLTSGVGEINLLNIHGVWNLDGDSFSPARQKMSQIIIDEARGLPNVILAGDSNAKMTNQAMLEIEKNLKPVFDNTLKSTFNMKRKTNPGYATAAVDLMYVSSSVKVISKDCPNVDISDHLPIVATLEIT